MSWIKRAPLFFILLAWFLGAVNSAIAQPAELKELVERRRAEQPPKWTYARLLESSEVVVIATFDSKRAVDDDLSPDGLHRESLQGLASKLNVLAVLKGDPKDVNQIEVFHFKWNDDVTVLGLHHSFISFQSRLPRPNIVEVVINDAVVGGGVLSDEMEWITPEYLVFLNRDKDGRYIPTSGQRFAGESLRIINE